MRTPISIAAALTLVRRLALDGAGRIDGDDEPGRLGLKLVQEEASA